MSSVLTVIALITFGFSVYYSITSRRYLRQSNVEYMRLYKSKGNITIGITLICLGFIQLFTFGPETTGWRIAVGLVFSALGLVNLIYGIKFYRLAAANVDPKN